MRTTTVSVVFGFGRVGEEVVCESGERYMCTVLLTDAKLMKSKYAQWVTQYSNLIDATITLKLF